ncbi:hypothetical protein DYH09_00575 [bacterium CPR1]|nr:hypothetical protein [bacterium CPR1]
MVQQWALVPFLSISATIVLVFLWVALSTRKRHDTDYASVARLRVYVIAGLMTLLTASFSLTIGHMPYPFMMKSLPDRVVRVTARQFGFVFENPPTAQVTEDPRIFRLGADVELDAISADVNHGLGVYDPGGVLVAQAQVMPGYVNKLRVKLEKPGTWTVLCMEYCGQAHHAMRQTFEVSATP